MLSGDSPANAEQRVFVNQCLYQPKDGLDEVQQYYERITLELLKRYSRKAGSSYHVDVVREYIYALCSKRNLVLKRLS